nr:hypothetical protein CFP56_78959 [Quercus suber]
MRGPCPPRQCAPLPQPSEGPAGGRGLGQAGGPASAPPPVRWSRAVLSNREATGRWGWHGEGLRRLSKCPPRESSCSLPPQAVHGPSSALLRGGAAVQRFRSDVRAAPGASWGGGGNRDGEVH